MKMFLTPFLLTLYSPGPNIQDLGKPQPPDPLADITEYVFFTLCRYQCRKVAVFFVHEALILIEVHL